MKKLILAIILFTAIAAQAQTTLKPQPTPTDVCGANHTNFVIKKWDMEKGAMTKIDCLAVRLNFDNMYEYIVIGENGTPKKETIAAEAVYGVETVYGKSIKWEDLMEKK